MATYKIDHPIVHADKLAVFTCNNEINEINIRYYFIKNWETLTLGMDNSTVLFIAGIHGKETGKFGHNENIQTLKNQVRLLLENHLDLGLIQIPRSKILNKVLFFRFSFLKEF